MASSTTSQKTMKKVAVAEGQTNSHPLDMKRVATLILGGGQGTRLFPLTEGCCKPATHVGGRFRLIDIPISNALNSNCLQIFILTQFLSSELHHHIHKTYQGGTFSKSSIEILAAEQRLSDHGWFQGTADAVRKSMPYLIDLPVDYFLILSGDQLYSMNFQDMMQTALEANADLVIAALAITKEKAKQMGVLKINEDGAITEFCEKPQDSAMLKHMRAPEFNLKRVKKPVDKKQQYLGSMGIYLFRREALLSLLASDHRDDFGKHLIPIQVQKGKTVAHLFNDYWEDIGSIGAFHQANLDMTSPTPPLNCYDEANPIYSHSLHLPPPHIHNALVVDSIICEGAIVEAAEIKNSILGPRTVVKEGSCIQNSYIMGHDFYKHPRDEQPLQIGKNCFINHAIIDKNVLIGNNVRLVNKKKLTNYSSEQICIRDGVIVVPRGSCLPDGFVL